MRSINIWVLIFLLFLLGAFMWLFWYLGESFAPQDQEAAVSASELEEIGLYDVTSFGADPTGQTDSTNAIRTAMDRAFREGQRGHKDRGAVFFPEGTYIFSDTLTGLVDRDLTRWNANLFIGSTKGSRPVLKFQPKPNDNSFNNPNSPKPAINFGPAIPGNEAMGMGQGFRNIEIVVGSQRTSGTIAVKFGGAQDNIIQNLKIKFEGEGHTGLQDMIGTNSVITNLEIEGGKYGIDGGDGRWPSFNNVVLTNQTDYALYNIGGGAPIALSGFKIVKASTPAIKTTQPTERFLSKGSLSLSDGTIEFTNPGNGFAIDNADDAVLSMQNVYIKGSKTIVRGNGGSYDLPNNSNWYRVSEYGSIVDGRTFNIINGERRTTDYTTEPTRQDPIQGLHRTHGIDMTNYPSPDVLLQRIKDGDRSVVNLADAPGVVRIATFAESNEMSSPDSTQGIKNVLSDPNVRFVLVPRGVYLVSDTIELGKNVHLMGVSNYLSSFKTHESWSPKSNVAMIKTPNVADATTRLSYMKLEWHSDQNRNWFTGVHWQSGKNSVFYQNMLRPLFVSVPGCSSSDTSGGFGNPRSEVLVNGNGGGRFYGVAPVAQGCSKQHPNFRGLRVENTNTPMIFYGLDPEDGHGDYQVEFSNVKNAQIRGFKCEDHPGILFHQNSDNIGLFGIGGCTGVTVRDVKNIYTGTVAAKNTDSARLLFEENFNSNKIELTAKQGLGVQRRGQVDFSVWDFTGGGILDFTPTPVTTTPITGPSSTPRPTNTIRPSIPTVTTTIVYNTNVCGKADVDGDGKFSIIDFQRFGEAYGNGNKLCEDTSVDYGECGGRDWNRDGKLNIIDFGGSSGFAKRYSPKNCNL